MSICYADPCYQHHLALNGTYSGLTSYAVVVTYTTHNPPAAIVAERIRQVCRQRRCAGTLAPLQSSRRSVLLAAPPTFWDQPLSDGQHRLAGGFAAFEIAVSLGGIAQRIGLVDRDFDRTALDYLEQFAGRSQQILAGRGVGVQGRPS